jgi:hypothetical protein
MPKENGSDTPGGQWQNIRTKNVASEGFSISTYKLDAGHVTGCTGGAEQRIVCMYLGRTAVLMK